MWLNIIEEFMMQNNNVGKKEKSNTHQISSYIPQKTIKNDCLQSLEIYYMKESGSVETYWLQPDETIKIPSNGVTSQLKLLQERRMIRIGNV
jgi:hypothetical protein